jgi:hypothetical protein
VASLATGFAATLLAPPTTSSAADFLSRWIANAIKYGWAGGAGLTLIFYLLILRRQPKG